jgi:excisionase family DNA binding protein
LNESQPNHELLSAACDEFVRSLPVRRATILRHASESKTINLVLAPTAEAVKTVTIRRTRQNEERLLPQKRRVTIELAPAKNTNVDSRSETREDSPAAQKHRGTVTSRQRTDNRGPVVDAASKHLSSLTADELLRALESADLSSPKLRRLRDWTLAQLHQPSTSTAHTLTGSDTGRDTGHLDDAVMTVSEFANAVNRDVSGIRFHCERGTLPAVKKGKTWLIPRSTIDAFLAAFPEDSKPGPKRGS